MKISTHLLCTEAPKALKAIVHKMLAPNVHLDDISIVERTVQNAEKVEQLEALASKRKVHIGLCVWIFTAWMIPCRLSRDSVVVVTHLRISVPILPPICR